jgi:catechol 2,3-dioxygenase-like lactoylglutathione lyase family enzyme
MSINSHIVFLTTKDLDRTANFYEQTLGSSLALDQGKCRIYNVAREAFLGFCEGGKVPVTDGVMVTLVTEDVDGWCRNLRSRGVQMEKEPSYNPDFKIYHCIFRDPNGYMVEIQRFEDPRWEKKTK